MLRLPYRLRYGAAARCHSDSGEAVHQQRLASSLFGVALLFMASSAARTLRARHLAVSSCGKIIAPGQDVGAPVLLSMLELRIVEKRHSGFLGCLAVGAAVVAAAKLYPTHTIRKQRIERLLLPSAAVKRPRA